MDKGTHVLSYLVIEPFIWLRDAFFPSRQSLGIQMSGGIQQAISTALRLTCHCCSLHTYF